jgi:hypothetical protein
MKKLIFLLVLFIGTISSCTDPGTVEKFSTKEPNLAPCVIEGDTVALYQYYPYTGSSIWIAKLKQTTTITYHVGKRNESVVFIDKNHYISGDVLLENDSIIIIKKK